MDLEQQTVFNYLVSLFSDRNMNQEFLKNMNILWPDFKLVIERSLRDLHYLKRENLTNRDYYALLPYIQLKSRVTNYVWLERIAAYCKERLNKPATSANILSVIEHNKLYYVVRDNLHYLLVEIHLEPDEFYNILLENRNELTEEMLEGMEF